MGSVSSPDEIELHATSDEERSGQKLPALTESDCNVDRRQSDDDDCGRQIGKHDQLQAQPCRTFALGGDPGERAPGRESLYRTRQRSCDANLKTSLGMDEIVDFHGVTEGLI